MHAIKLFENEFAQIDYYSQLNALSHTWFSETTEFLFDKGYREQINILVRFLELYRPKNLLLDLKNGRFSIDVESQKWLQEVVYPKQYEIGLIRKAYILGNSYPVLSISLKQTVEEDPNQFFTVEYFGERTKGLEWLASFEGLSRTFAKKSK